jgi:hypothetical protein
MTQMVVETSQLEMEWHVSILAGENLNFVFWWVQVQVISKPLTSHDRFNCMYVISACYIFQFTHTKEFWIFI